MQSMDCVGVCVCAWCAECESVWAVYLCTTGSLTSTWDYWYGYYRDYYVLSGTLATDTGLLRRVTAVQLGAL